jgi:hypothetical protein
MDFVGSTNLIWNVQLICVFAFAVVAEAVENVPRTEMQSFGDGAQSKGAHRPRTNWLKTLENFFCAFNVINAHLRPLSFDQTISQPSLVIALHELRDAVLCYVITSTSTAASQRTQNQIRARMIHQQRMNGPRRS